MIYYSLPSKKKHLVTINLNITMFKFVAKKLFLIEERVYSSIVLNGYIILQHPVAATAVSR